ncbi:MAG: DUF1805 domain-containing protein [Candidatus Omnitrophica bacterium]|nr:DUF1805 domain-containing protein [Candidatus Omnitrophota bacterium]MBD3269102.1 DUF1805 domain-containing protein [Candidatus Omnitrophota bacterium]
MVTKRQVRISDSYIEAFCIKLGRNNLIGLIGKKGYIMCGYLDLKTADKFEEIGVKITGVSTIDEALKSKVHSLSHKAGKAGIFKGQPIKDVIKIIA